MKKYIVSFLIALSLILIVSYFYVNHNMKDIMQPDITQQTTLANETEQTETYTYTITSAQNGQYYGIAEDKTGIFFTEDFIKSSSSTITEGDKIKAVFPNEEHDSQLFQVEKVS